MTAPDIVDFERVYTCAASEPCPKCDTVSVVEVWGPEPANVPAPSSCHQCGADLPPPKPGYITVTGIDRDAGTITVDQ